MPKFLMVLNDDETYTDLTGCKIVAIDEDEILKSAYDVDTVVEVICNAHTRGVTEDDEAVRRDPDYSFAFSVAEVIASFD